MKQKVQKISKREKDRREAKKLSDASMSNYSLRYLNKVKIIWLVSSLILQITSAYLSFDYYAQVNHMLFLSEYIQKLSKARAEFETMTMRISEYQLDISILLLYLELVLFLPVHFSDITTNSYKYFEYFP